MVARAWRGRTAERVEAVAGEIAGEPAEIGATEKDGEAVDGDEPEGERLQADARLQLFALDRGVDLLNVLGFAVIHALAGLPVWMLLVHFVCSPGGGGEGGVTDFTSFNGCVWFRAIM